MNTPLIQEFFSYLRYEKHFSDHTLKCYSTELQHDREPPHRFTQEEIRELFGEH